MAAAKKQKGSAQKIKKKIWLPIHAPKYFNEMELGHTHVIEHAQAVGKIVTANLMTLTRDMKRQHINLSFAVDKVSGEKATTKLVKFKILPSAIKRMVRRRRDRIDDSFHLITKDGVNIRIKPLLITRGNTTKSARSAMRIRAASIIIKTAEEKTYDQLTELVVQNRLQRMIKEKLAKIYPVRTCEIRELYIETEKQAKKSMKREAVEEPKPEVEEEFPDEEVKEKSKEDKAETEKESDDKAKEAEKKE